MTKKKSILLPALLVMLLWGSLFPMVKIGYQYFSIVSDGAVTANYIGSLFLFAGIRFTVCGGIITFFALLRGKSSFTPVPKAFPKLMLSGLYAVILHYGFTYTALSLETGSKTAILKQVGVLFYVCFSALFIKEDRLTKQKLAGVLLGLAGVFAINLDGGTFTFGIGDLLIIAASFCTVFSNVTSKLVFETVEPITATGVSQLFGGIVLLTAGVLLGGRVHPTSSMSFLVFGYICFASIFGYCIWFLVVKRGELSRLFIIKFAEPVFAAVCGYFVANEDIFKWQYLAAFVLIAGGIAVTEWKRSDAK